MEKSFCAVDSLTKAKVLVVLCLSVTTAFTALLLTILIFNKRNILVNSLQYFTNLLTFKNKQIIVANKETKLSVFICQKEYVAWWKIGK